MCQMHEVGTSCPELASGGHSHSANFIHMLTFVGKGKEWFCFIENSVAQADRDGISFDPEFEFEFGIGLGSQLLVVMAGCQD